MSRQRSAPPPLADFSPPHPPPPRSFLLAPPPPPLPVSLVLSPCYSSLRSPPSPLCLSPAPPLPLARSLSLLQLTSPDRFDTYSAGVMLLQMCIPEVPPRPIPSPEPPPPPPYQSPPHPPGQHRRGHKGKVMTAVITGAARIETRLLSRKLLSSQTLIVSPPKQGWSHDGARASHVSQLAQLRVNGELHSSNYTVYFVTISTVIVLYYL